MVFSLVFVDFVDGHGGVCHGRLDGLLLDDGLDILVYLVVYVLTRYGWIGRGSVLSLANCAVVLELCLLGFEALLDMVVIAVLDVAVLYTGHLVTVLF